MEEEGDVVDFRYYADGLLLSESAGWEVISEGTEGGNYAPYLDRNEDEVTRSRYTSFQCAQTLFDNGRVMYRAQMTEGVFVDRGTEGRAPLMLHQKTISAFGASITSAYVALYHQAAREDWEDEDLDGAELLATVATEWSETCEEAGVPEPDESFEDIVASAQRAV